MTLRMPRPRTFDDVCDRIESLSARIETVSNGQLAVSQQLGALTAEVASLKGGVGYRERESSFHDFDPELEELRRTLVARVKDQTRFDSIKARAIAKEAADRAKLDDKAAAYDAIKRTGIKVIVGVVVGVLVAMAAAHFGLHP